MQSATRAPCTSNTVKQPNSTAGGRSANRRDGGRHPNTVTAGAHRPEYPLDNHAAHSDADRRSHAHNDYLQLAAEAGLLGLLAFALLYARALALGADAVASPSTTSATARSRS